MLSEHSYTEDNFVLSISAYAMKWLSDSTDYVAVKPEILTLRPFRENTFSAAIDSHLLKQFKGRHLLLI